MVVSNCVATNPRRHCTCDRQAGIDHMARWGLAVWGGLLWNGAARRILTIGWVEIRRWRWIASTTDNQAPLPPQLMQTPVPLQVLHKVSPEPRNLPVPLQTLQRPEPWHGPHWLGPLLPVAWPSPFETPPV